MSAGPLALNHLNVGVTAGIGILCLGVAAAQSPVREPIAARGAVIAAQGAAGGAPACAQCHAYNGASDGSGAFPRLAGQSASYLAKELRDYASGVRTNAVMTPIAKGLSPDDTADVAAYYANVNAPYLPLASPDPLLIKRGEQLATNGDAAMELQSCNNCHGPGGAGELPAIPYLAGQYAHYIAFQLTMWQRGFRNNSPDAMADIAKRLGAQDIAAVAAYYQQVDASALAATQPAK
ncbi:MAG TPA: c-type cytochrome [Steroidobacteraceae bacterium]|nr:c-type cytochrome [Steroidobacteraceae bacterium]